MTTADNIQTATDPIVTGGVSAAAVAFLHESVTSMIPWLFAAIPLIALDLYYGVKVKRYRYETTGNKDEKPRFSTALRMTVGKTFSYICWVILSSTLSLKWGSWLEWVVLGLVILNELASIWGHVLELKGLELSFIDLMKALIKALFRIGGHHAGTDLSDIDTDDIIKPKDGRARSKKTGRFVKVPKE
jgi:hypothetical protein